MKTMTTNRPALSIPCVAALQAAAFAVALSLSAQVRADRPGSGSPMSGVFGKPELNPEFVQWQARQRAAAAGRGFAPAGGEAGRGDLVEGLIPSSVDFSYLSGAAGRDAGAAMAPLPVRYDPREEFAMTPVRHQDPFQQDLGTCWAQATVGSMETWLTKNGEGLHQLSVRNLANRTGFDRPDPNRPRGWFGGNHQMSSAYLLRWGGPVPEAADPYIGQDGHVNYTLESPDLPAAWHLQQTRLVPARKSPLDNDGLKRAILECGGLYAPMRLYSPYYAGTGELNPYWNTNGAYYCPQEGATHAVTLVGWDDNYPRSNFNPKFQPRGDGAFIVKDSYGDDPPRDRGYIYVSYYDASFASRECCAFPMLESADNYSAIYQHDPLGMTLALPLETDAIWLANVFTAEKDGVLAAVGFYSLSPGEEGTIAVYVDCAPSDPSSGRECAGQTYRIGTYAGFRTHVLEKEVPIRKGQRFAVVTQVRAAGELPVLVPIEGALENMTSRAGALPGQSFYSVEGPGGAWYDLTGSLNGTFNFCIKAYAKDAAGQPDDSGLLGEPAADGPTPPVQAPAPAPRGIWGNLGADAFKQPAH